jgi:hypothetical protein
VGNRVVRSPGSREDLSCCGQCRMVCFTVCAGNPQGHWGIIPGTFTLASQALRPITSVLSRYRAVAVALSSSLYN